MQYKVIQNCECFHPLYVDEDSDKLDKAACNLTSEGKLDKAFCYMVSQFHCPIIRELDAGVACIFRTRVERRGRRFRSAEDKRLTFQNMLDMLEPEFKSIDHIS